MQRARGVADAASYQALQEKVPQDGNQDCLVYLVDEALYLGTGPGEDYPDRGFYHCGDRTSRWAYLGIAEVG